MKDEFDWNDFVAQARKNTPQPRDFRTAPDKFVWDTQHKLAGYVVSAAATAVRVREYLLAHGHGEANRYSFEVADGYAWHIPHDQFDLYAMTDGNARFLVGTSKAPFDQHRMFVYRFYAPIDADARADYFGSADDVLRYLDHIAQFYTDESVTDTPARPTLGTLVANLGTALDKVLIGGRAVLPLLSLGTMALSCPQLYTRDVNHFFFELSILEREMKLRPRKTKKPAA